MAAEKSVWIQNTHTGDVVVRVKTADETGRVTFTEKLFPNYRVDKMTGRMRHSGYTELSEDAFGFFFERSPLFKKFLEELKFVKYDSPPPGATNPAEQIIVLRAEIAALKAENGKQKTEIAALAAENGRLTAELTDSRKGKPKAAKGDDERGPAGNREE
jgi:uncharacterized small protein (DUF1192 family)